MIEFTSDTGESFKPGVGLNHVFVLVIPDTEYNETLTQITKQLTTSNERICYVSLNRPYYNIVKNFQSAGIDISNFFFIDAITQTAEIPDKIHDCVFVSSPGSLTELSLAISNLLERDKFDYLIFDSLSTLLVYESDTTVTKFVHSLMAKIRVVGCMAIFTCLKQDNGSVLMRDINMFADKILDVEHGTMFR